MSNNTNYEKTKSADKPELPLNEWIASKKQEKEAVYKLIDKTAVETVTEPTKMRAYLNVQSHLHGYSVTNALLVSAQCPNAVKVRDYEGWAKRNVFVKKGTTGITVLEPHEYAREDGTTAVGYNLKRVFDISQTRIASSSGVKSNDDPRELVAMMLDANVPVQINMTDKLPPNMGAFYDNANRILFIQNGIGDSVLLCQAVARELGHAQLAVNLGKSYERGKMSYQAECIGYMLCNKYGVDTKAFNVDNIPGEWRLKKDPKNIKPLLIPMRDAVNDIASRTNKLFYERKLARTEQNKEQAR